MKIILLISFVFQVIYTIETTILQYLTGTDQQTLIVANELFNVKESQRYFQRQPFTCLTLLPSNLTKNHLEKVYKLNATYNYKHLETQSNEQTATNIPTQPNAQNQQTKQIIGVYEDYDYDKILDLLHGTCTIHETNQFLYEYCHKDKVRQFDNLATLQRMGKQSYEDIAMGYFNYQDALKKSKSDQDRHLRPGNEMFKIKYSENGDLTVINTLLKNIPDMTDQQREMLAKTLHENMKDKIKAGQTTQPQITISTIPTRSVVYDKKNLFTVSDINHKEYELNKEDKVIHLNYPIIKSNKYFTSVQYTHEVTCQYYFNDTKGVYITKGIVISFFELAFLGNVSKCDKVIDVSFRPIEQKPYESPFYANQFRQIQDFLIGYVDEICTNNWDWDMDGNRDHVKGRNNHLQPQNTLWLEMIINVSGSLQFRYETVTVKKNIAPGVVKLKQNLRQLLMNFKQQTVKSPSDFTWINNCRIISKKPVVETSLTNENKILRQNLIQIKQKPDIQGHKAGDQIVCLCKFTKYTDEFLEMQLTLGNQVFQSTAENNFNSYFEFYQKRTVKTVNPQTEPLHEICKMLICFDVAAEKDNKNQEIKDNIDETNTEKKFTQIHKFTSKSPIVKDNLESENQILIIDVSQKGIVKIHTQLDGEKYVYLISTSMLMKIRLFPNGTKQIVRQNSFYENETTSNFLSWLGNSVFIHQNYIWRGYDKIVFPRMNMGHQRITSIERMSGYAYLRKWDLSKMKFKDSFYLSTIKQRLQDAFRVKKYPIFAKDEKPQAKVQNQFKVQEQEQEPKSESEVKANDQNAIDSEVMEQIERQDFSSVDFAKSQFKPLNKSVSVRYQYFHGDYCGEPHNRYRRTNVDMQCGEPWLKIQKVREVSPCIYELQISTRLLCREEYHKAVQKIQTLNKNTNSRVKFQKGLVCYPQDAWDNAVYIYDVGQKDVYMSAG